MRLIFFNDHQLGAVTANDNVADFSDLLTGFEILPPQQLLNRVIEEWDVWQPQFAERIAADDGPALSTVTLRAPVPKPTSIVCMAVNYMEFGTLKEKPAQQAFFKNSHGVIGPEGVMHLPDHPASIFEGEAELALVIGKRASGIDAANADDYIFGYINFVDGSARGLIGGMGLPYAMKCQDDSAPLGPYLVTKDEIDDPMKLDVKQWINGKITHDYCTDDMAHDIGASLQFITSNTTLEPGDVVALGTNHAGLHPFQDGDVVEQEAEGLGRLRFTVADALKRTWQRQSRGERAAAGEKGPAPQLTGKYAS